MNPDPIAIDAAWLAARSRPYLLDQPDTTYVLAVDVTTPGVGIVFGAANVTLSLAGHTLTYGDAAPCGPVPDGSFDSDAAGWDLTGAYATTVGPAAPYRLPADRCLIVAGIEAGPQIIISPPICIPEAGRCYTAAVTASTLDTDGDQPASRGCDVRLDVIDGAGNPLPVHRCYQGAGGFGEGGYCSFVPADTSPVRLRITLLPGSGTGPIVCALTRAVISRSNDFGILCTGTDANSLSDENGYTDQAALGGAKGYASAIANLSPESVAAYTRCVAPTILGPGTIRQGRGRGQFGTAIFALNARGAITVRSVTIEVTGDDTQGIEASSGVGDPTAADSREIVGNTLRFDVANITARGNLYCAINVVNGGPALVSGNTIAGNPQAGIKAGATAIDPATGAAYPHVVRGNVLTPRTLITNGYGIVLGGSNIKACSNVIVAPPESGSSRGIVIENWTSLPYTNIEVCHNYVDVWETPNREYGRFAVAKAFRFRNTASTSTPIRDVNIHDNIFIARAGPGGQRDAIGARFSLENQGNTMDNAGIVFDGNRVVATLEADEPGSLAIALSFDEAEWGVRPICLDNQLESSDVGIRLGGDDGGGAAICDVMMDNTLLLRPDRGIARSGPMIAGYRGQRILQCHIIDTSSGPGANTAIDRATAPELTID